MMSLAFNPRPMHSPPPPLAEILIVDDEPAMRRMIADYLGAMGFAVREAGDGTQLDAALRLGRADVILLDVNMPGEDGLSIARRLRARGERAGLLMVTAQDNDQMRGTAMGEAADDYIAKPFALSELAARIRAVLRRMPECAPPAARLIPFGRMRIDPDARLLIAPDGSGSDLTEVDFALLDALLRHPRQILSRDRLCEMAQGRPLETGERSIDIRIARLRKRIEPDPASPVTLCSVRGEGYFYNPDAVR